MGYKLRKNTLWTNPEYYEYSKNLFKEVYSNKYGNGDFESGDGFNYRGKGLIQLTWKSNYEGFTIHHNELYPEDQRDFVLNPDLLIESNLYATRGAFYYWYSRNINSVSNEINDTSMLRVTEIINGGYNGLQDRKLKTQKIYEIIKKNKIYE